MNLSEHRPPEFLDENKLLSCVHCGLCLGSCPTYLETGNENESPRGRLYIMRGLQSGRLPLEQGTVRHIDLCLGCRACEAACPSGVQYGALLEGTRDFIEHNYQRTPFQRFLRRFVIEKVFPNPSRMKLALLPARFLESTGLARFAPKRLRDAIAFLPPSSSNHPLPELSPATVAPAKGRIGFIRGCVMSVLFAETNRSTVELLNRLGFDVVTPSTQVCCGALFAHSGQMNQARDLARKNIQTFRDQNLDAIVINAAGCGSTLKEYGSLFHGDAGIRQEAELFSGRIRDITEFLVEHGQLNCQQNQSAGLVTYHDACHLAHPQRITKAPRDLVQAVAGSNYVALPEADVCCGSAGSYNLTEPEMAGRLQSRKIDNILRTKAKTIVTTNPGCILQMRAGLAQVGSDVRVVHMSDFLLEHAVSETTKLAIKQS